MSKVMASENQLGVRQFTMLIRQELGGSVVMDEGNPRGAVYQEFNLFPLYKLFQSRDIA